MTRRQRLMATLRGESIDRPAVNFYEVGGTRMDPDDPSPFNACRSDSWRELLAMAEERTDLIRMRAPRLTQTHAGLANRFFQREHWTENRSKHTRLTLKIGGRTMTSHTRRDPGVDTLWKTEHLLKNVDDLQAYLELPDELSEWQVDVQPLLDADAEVGERGIVMVDTADPLCIAAGLFEMGGFTVIALTEPEWFQRLLEKLAGPVLRRTKELAAAFPGHLWRICGAEYAAEPYLPPRLFAEYETRYTRPLVEAIQHHGGYARLHCHGRVRANLSNIVGMHVDGLDPVEPPPQGDVELIDVRREHGRDLVLFGNIEARDIEYLEPEPFESKVVQALREGTFGEGRGFVLMPSSCPIGQEITPRAMHNYEVMVDLAENWAG